jgi:hypothetical protein
MKLVATKALGADMVAAMNADQIADAVVKLEKVRLDDECIEEIENLEGLGTVTQLQLQRNRLQSICNLESLQHLQLLSLASNDIMDLRNLTCLVALKALDVGYNLLDEVAFFCAIFRPLATSCALFACDASGRFAMPDHVGLVHDARTHSRWGG